MDAKHGENFFVTASRSDGSAEETPVLPRSGTGAALQQALRLAVALVLFFFASRTSGKDIPRVVVEVRPSGGVAIMALETTYGEVLRALQAKLHVAMDISPLAETLKLNYASIDAATPEEAFQELLSSSGLDYALLRQPQGHRLEKVVIFRVQHERSRESVNQPTAAAAGPTSEAGRESVGRLTPSTAGQASDNDQTSPVPRMKIRPLSEAGEAVGLESGSTEEALAEHIEDLPPEAQPVIQNINSVAVIVPLADAAKVMGVPRGVSPADVGRSIIIPLPPAGQPRP